MRRSWAVTRISGNLPLSQATPKRTVIHTANACKPGLCFIPRSNRFASNSNVRSGGFRSIMLRLPSDLACHSSLCGILTLLLCGLRYSIIWCDKLGFSTRLVLSSTQGCVVGTIRSFISLIRFQGRNSTSNDNSRPNNRSSNNFSSCVPSIYPCAKSVIGIPSRAHRNVLLRRVFPLQLPFSRDFIPCFAFSFGTRLLRNMNATLYDLRYFRRCTIWSLHMSCRVDDRER